jgi:aminomethyltransferase
VDLQSLPEGSAKLSVITNENGGIIDDTMITNRGNHIFMVVNAGCADKDIAHIKKHLAAFTAKGGDVQFEQLDRSLIALQGPLSEKILQDLVKYELSKMPFMTAQEMFIAGAKCLVSRCGYTGEDGFEISVSHADAIGLAKLLLSKNSVKAAGLGARDTLRLEAGLCLYGNDLEQHITPIEASLAWLIPKRRREEGGFLGSDKILHQLKNPETVTKKRVGFIVNGAPAREHTSIHHPVGSDSNTVGEITSGTLSPVLKKAISMGYINTPFSKIGTEVSVKVRGKLHPAIVSKMPFVPHGYKKL